MMQASDLEEDVVSPDSSACAAAMPRDTVAAMQEVTRECMAKGDSHTIWALHLLSLPGVAPFPRVEIGTMLLNFCFNQPADGIAWNYLKYAFALALVCPLLTLAFLTARLIPVRHQHPDWYQSFLDLASTFVLCLGATKSPGFRERCIRYVDEALQLSQLRETPVKEFGTCISFFLFCLIKRLIDAVTEDWNLPPAWNESHALGSMHGRMTVIEMEDGEDERRGEENLKMSNSLLALQLVTKIMQNKRTAALLRLVRRMLPDQWSIFTRNLRSLDILTQKEISSAPKEAPEALRNLAAAFQRALHSKWRLSQLPVIQALLDSGSQSGSFGNCWGAGCINPWLPMDIYMEATMVRHRMHAKSPSASIADIMKALHAVQGFTWHEVFLGTWTAALRLVQRVTVIATHAHFLVNCVPKLTVQDGLQDCDWAKGPKPHTESRLCILLCHVPLACGLIIDEEEHGRISNGTMRGDSISMSNGTGEDKEKQFPNNRRAAFVLSLQVLGQFEALLSPPKLAVVPANQAAASIASAIGSVNTNVRTVGDSTAMEGSNLRHLIVEACITRGLLDRSAYFWLGRTGPGESFPSSNHPQKSPWTAFMQGAPLTSSLQAALTVTPAGSLVELEKVFQIAISGPEEERAAAASILCGASFSRGWNVQEHAVRLAVRLLSPPPLGTESRGPGSHLIAHGPMLSAALDSMTPEETLRILALNGMVPELAAALLPVCEVFGSLPPTVPPASGPGEDVYKIFSLAFLLLVRLWKFLRPPLEHSLLGGGLGVGPDLSLEYLLHIRDTQAAGQGDKSSINPKMDPMQAKRMSPRSPSYSHSVSSTRSPVHSVSQNVTVESFPKLKAWYINHQACIASPLSGLMPGTAAHNVAERLLRFMFRKFAKPTSSCNTGSSSNSSAQSGEDKPAWPAWDVIAAVPVVVDEVLKACSHGTLRPRDLTTGLRDMVDFLPATIASVVSCCGLEVYRGLHAPASMNGNDWPSPAANLFAVEAEIQSILENFGVSVPNLITGSVGGNAPAVLPLPLAALLSLTITCKMDRQADKRIFSMAGPALENACMGGPWPSMAVVAALWSQKMPHVRDFVVFNATQAVFQQNKQAISQILQSCFSVGLCTSSSLVPKLQVHGGVGALLGHGRWHDPSSGMSAIGPAILYLTSCPSLHDVLFVSDEILTLVAEASREIAVQGLIGREVEPTSFAAGLSCANPSLSTAVARAAQASTLGAALVAISGGLNLVRQLFVESLPTWLLSSFCSKGSKNDAQGTILEGYAIARFALLSGTLAWGVSRQNVPGIPLQWQRRHVLGVHLELLASGLDGQISIKCKYTTWRSYVIGFIALMVACTPEWILDVKDETLQRLAKGLRWWQQHELAFTLLENGGPAAVGAAAEHAMG